MQSASRMTSLQMRRAATRLYHFRPMPHTNFQPCPPEERTKGKWLSAEEAVALTVKDNTKVYSHMGACTPLTLLKTMGTTLNGKVKNVEVQSMHIEGGILPHLKPEAAGSFRHHSMFMGANVRKATNEGRADNQAVFFSEVPNMYRKGIMKSDVAFLNVSPPDAHGWCTMGVSVSCCHAAALASKTIVAQVNPNVPRTHGDGAIHVNQINYLVECNDPLPSHPPGEVSEQETAIGKHIAGLVPDGATLQMGIGAIPDATLSFLTNHKDLGIHTEMFADGVLKLIESGVVNNCKKKIHPGKNILTFMVGSKRLYDFVDDNPTVHFLDVDYTNDPFIIAQNPKVHAINSAIEVDLTGQVVADSIGTMFYSGIGGQMDFVQGASRSEGGKAIIALPSITDKGISKIVPFIKQGAGVVTTRGHVQYVVTEFGAAYLHGKCNRERSVALANIAHPSVRPQLFDFIKKRYGRL